MRYEDLTIQQKISLKGILNDWGDIAIERFQRSLQKVVYNSKTQTRIGGMKRDSRGRFLTRDRSSRRTGRLLADWSKTIRDGGYSTSGSTSLNPVEGPAVVGVLIQFNLYGRFVDMGVGRNHSSLDKSVARQLRDRQPTRRRAKRWYSGTKGYEVGQLRSILARQYGIAVAQVAESALTLTANIVI